ncbi:MAG: cytidylate kinase-like family protein, partial [Oscillibacter sp.]|nr:cytidylate kinase-like family protein [Oscillibacter sp.]
MKTYQKEHLALAGRIYDLDSEVYRLLGSSLSRVYNGRREDTVRELAGLMEDVTKGHFLRSEMALIGNMARTIKDKEQRARVM